MKIQYLIVDDDSVSIELTRQSIVNAIESPCIRAFSNAREVLHYLIHDFSNNMERPKAILMLDLEMPGMSGWQFLDCFALLKPTVQNRVHIIIVSASVDVESKVRAAQTGCVAEYIAKDDLYKNLYFTVAKYLKAA